MSSSQIKPITSLRGIAALAVFFHHAIYWLTNSIAQTVSDKTAFFSNGYLWVDFFFILSGFILTLVYYDKFKANTLKYKAFLAARFARIYPLHLFMLVLFFLAEFYRGRSSDYTTFTAPYQLIDLFRNLLLVQSVQINPTLTTWNVPSWSISAEWMMYLVLPFMARTLITHSKSALCIFVIIAAFFFLYLIENATARQLDLTGFLGISRCILEGAIGAALATLKVNGRLSYYQDNGSILFILSSIFVLAGLHFDFNDLLIVLGMAMLILAAATECRVSYSLLGGRLGVYLGEISYSIYMTHWFILLLIGSATIRIFNIDPFTTTNPTEIVLIISGALLLTLTFSVFTYHCIERPCRRYLKKKLPG